MTDETIATAKVNEYGGILNVSTAIDGSIPEGVMEAASAMIDGQTQEIREVLDICGDAHIIDNFHMVKGPNVDILNRFKPLGWYGKFVSPNYDKLQAHFACRKRHIPETITMDFINQLITEYARNYSDEEEYDDD